MKVIFDKTIWDVSALSEMFDKSRLLRFLREYQGIRATSITQAIEEARDDIGDADLIQATFDHFYPNKLILIDDLYEICTNAAVNRRCKFRFVPYRVRIIEDGVKHKRKAIRIKGKKIAFGGGTGKYTKSDAQKAIKKMGGKIVPYKQAEVIIVGGDLTQKQKLNKDQNCIEIMYIEDRMDKVLK